jgi:hypothetical protein
MSPGTRLPTVSDDWNALQTPSLAVLAQVPQSRKLSSSLQPRGIERAGRVSQLVQAMTRTSPDPHAPVLVLRVTRGPRWTSYFKIRRVGDAPGWRMSCEPQLGGTVPGMTTFSMPPVVSNTAVRKGAPSGIICADRWVLRFVWG